MEQKKKVINGVTYLVTEMDAFRALKIQTKLIKILGPGISGLKVGKTLNETLLNIVPKLAENFDDELVNQLVLDLFESNVFYEKNGTSLSIDFSTYFRGKVFDMWKVVGFILEVNFNLGEFIKLASPTTETQKEDESKEN